MNALIEGRLEAWIADEGYCDNALTVASLAKQLQVKRTVLSAYINQQKGMAFRDWINALRIDLCKRIIVQEPHLSQEQVADRVGYNSRSYFTVAFKKQEGVTPAQWRKAHLQ